MSTCCHRGRVLPLEHHGVISRPSDPTTVYPSLALCGFRPPVRCGRPHRGSLHWVGRSSTVPTDTELGESDTSNRASFWLGLTSHSPTEPRRKSFGEDRTEPWQEGVGEAEAPVDPMSRLRPPCGAIDAALEMIPIFPKPDLAQNGHLPRSWKPASISGLNYVEVRPLLQATCEGSGPFRG